MSKPNTNPQNNTTGNDPIDRVSINYINFYQKLKDR